MKTCILNLAGSAFVVELDKYNAIIAFLLDAPQATQVYCETQGRYVWQISATQKPLSIVFEDVTINSNALPDEPF